MKPSVIPRIIGIVILISVGLALSNQIAIFSATLNWFTLSSFQINIIIVAISSVVGYLVAPMLIQKPIESLRSTIQHMPAQILFSVTVGLFVGLALGLLSAYPASMLPPPLGQIMPVLLTLGFGYLGMSAAHSRPELLQGIRTRFFPKETVDAPPTISRPVVLLDTSVIIDGRIADICSTGFIQGELVVPLFVLNELQHVADSADALRRNRGRRGLEVLRRLQEESPVPVRITDADDVAVREVDDKLIVLAKTLNGAILTNDYNLNRVAELQAVKVLNVNELANAVKTVLLPGESFSIHILQEGKEASQGVGYLDDGTMVVVEDGARYIGATLSVVVNKVLQTAAGRMIFARPGEE